MIVHVVSFAPANEAKASTGGFQWWPAEHLLWAERFYVNTVKDSAGFGGAWIVRLLTVKVHDGLDRDQVTEELDARLDELEVTGPALRQYVPAGTNPEWIPKGQVA